MKTWLQVLLLSVDKPGIRGAIMFFTQGNEDLNVFPIIKKNISLENWILELLLFLFVLYWILVYWFKTVQWEKIQTKKK